MKKLQEFVDSNGIDVVPVSSSEIDKAQQELNLKFDSAYLSYLNICGQLEFEYLEFYGLGVKPNSYLNVVKNYQELSQSNTYPQTALPILDLGDGHYSLYDLVTGHVVEWTKDGVIRELNSGLEQYLLDVVHAV